MGAKSPLKVAVVDGQVCISIGVDTLAHAVSYSDWANRWRDGNKTHGGEYIRTFAITNAQGFAQDVGRMMQAELGEDGSTLLSNFLDKATEAAVDDGSEHCEYEQEILHGTTAQTETWATIPPTPVSEAGD